MNWVLPEYIQDVLPGEAARLEFLRRAFLDACRQRGYQQVSPPMFEYLESLLTGAGHDLNLRTFKLVDQISGRSLGVRADITPQVARIDAHLLNRSGVSRLCYCGRVLHALPANLNASRDLMQMGAEVYGHAGIEADVEVISLLHELLGVAGIDDVRIDLSHVGLFRALARRAGLAPEQEQTLFGLLQDKDVPAIAELLQGCSESMRAPLLALPALYGGREVLVRAAAVLPAEDAVQASLAELRAMADSLPALPLSFDLSDLRGYHYHSGVVLAAYGAGAPAPLALGGRYDSIGEAFGRARPATGFSLDLRELARYGHAAQVQGGILAPMGEGEHAAALVARVARLRAEGEVVMYALPGHAGTWSEAGCDRQLTWRDGQWVVEALHEDDLNG